MMTITWITLVGGLCLLAYGLNVARDNLQKMLGDRLRDVTAQLTENRIIALLTGFFTTVILQTSSASIAMFVGFAAASLLTLTQAMALILGADIGATVMVQLLAFRIEQYSLFIIIVGFLSLNLLGKKHENLGKFVLGIGFIFLGMWQMGNATLQFKDSHLLQALIALLKDYPLVCLLLAAFATAIIQSSAAFLGILMSLTATGIIDLSHALPLVLGANLGSCTLPLIISLKSTDRGRQVSASHILLKVAGIIICFPLLSPFSDMVLLTTESPARQIANAHFLFNFFLAITFLPFIGWGSRLINLLIPLSPEPEQFKPKYLDKHILATPSFATGQTKREVIRMAEIVEEMIIKIIPIIKKNDLELLSGIEVLEDRADILYREIKKYIVQISREAITEEQASQLMEMINLTSDLENIGDTIDKSILPLIKVKISKKILFSDEGFKEIQDFHSRVVENYQLALSAFTTHDIELCHKVIRAKDKLLELELSLREKHLERLKKDIKESIDSSAIHLEILSYLRRISSFISNIAYPILQKEESTT